MPTDLRALLAAIVADPADDTARLVYADCLEEQGNIPRAQFIRLQIEAERLHPDSNTRARLEEKAQDLLNEHWIDWWSDVCRAVDLAAPVPQPRGMAARLATGLRLRNTPGHPYEISQVAIRKRNVPYWNQKFLGWRRTIFRRGFPDSVMVMLTDMYSAHPSPARWVDVSPLAALHAIAPYTEAWLDGPHLANLGSLTLEDYDPVALQGALDSPHLIRLDTLQLHLDYTTTLHRAFYDDELARALASPRIRQLKRLRVPVWSDRTAEIVAAAGNLAGLETLEVELEPADLDVLEVNADVAGPSRRITTLAGSPHLAGLRELRVVGPLDAAGVAATLRDPTWTGLRKLDLQVALPWGHDDPLSGPDDLPELEELRLTGVSYSVGQMAAFARSPLLKRLRHFAVRGFPELAADEEIADAVDPDRIETFAIGDRETPRRVEAYLRDRFGDRFRLLP